MSRTTTSRLTASQRAIVAEEVNRAINRTTDIHERLAALTDLAGRYRLTIDSVAGDNAAVRTDMTLDDVEGLQEELIDRAANVRALQVNVDLVTAALATIGVTPALTTDTDRAAFTINHDGVAGTIDVDAHSIIDDFIDPPSAVRATHPTADDVCEPSLALSTTFDVTLQRAAASKGVKLGAAQRQSRRTLDLQASPGRAGRRIAMQAPRARGRS